MDKEELLRLKQLNGLASLFKNKDFSKSWETMENKDNEILWIYGLYWETIMTWFQKSFFDKINVVR